jgi:hypothetical protein
LLARLANLEASVAEDGGGELDRRQRIQAIEKILAVELGITDGTTVALVEAAMPSGRAAKQAPEREVAALAVFLRERLGPQLAET